MKTPFMRALGAALDSLNANHGRGDVLSFQMFLDGRGVFQRKPYQCRPESRTFRIKHTRDRLTVYALRHQRTVPLT
jgi:hypothetical protein